MGKVQIKKLGQNEVELYNTIREASQSVDTKMPEWKVQMLIANAIISGKRVFGCRWQKVA